MKTTPLIAAMIVVVGLTALCRTGHAAAIAYDTAGDSAYSVTPLPFPPPSGGYGWGGGWIHDGFGHFSVVPIAGFAPPSATTNISSPPTAGGRLFVETPASQYSLPNYTTRDFNGALTPGQKFAFDFDTALVDPRNTGSYFVVFGGNGPAIGIGAAPTASPDYWIGTFNYPGLQGGFDTGLPLTDQGVHMEFAVQSSSQVVVSLTSLAAGGEAVSIPMPSSTAMTSITMYNQSYPFSGADAGLYFNNLAITPEPAPALILTVVGFALLGRRRPTDVYRSSGKP